VDCSDRGLYIFKVFEGFSISKFVELPILFSFSNFYFDDLNSI